jgi:hypothetical protein
VPLFLFFPNYCNTRNYHTIIFKASSFFYLIRIDPYKNIKRKKKKEKRKKKKEESLDNFTQSSKRKGLEVDP